MSLTAISSLERTLGCQTDEVTNIGRQIES